MKRQAPEPARGRSPFGRSTRKPLNPARAAAGEFTDYADTHACPITELHRLCRQFGLHDLAERVAAGDFDATKAESDEWAASQSGREAFDQLLPEMRAMFGDPKFNQ